MKDTSKQARIEAAEKFFNLMFGAVKERKHGYLWTKPDKKTFSFAVSNADERKVMAQKAIELNDAGQDVYFGINLMDNAPAKNARATAAKVTLQTATVADIDIKSQAHKGDPDKYPPDFDTANSFLPFPVSLTVNSGFGQHDYCIYSEPITITAENREQAKKRNQDFISMIRSRAGKYSKAVDGTSDLARVLRVPGTFNYKLGKENAPLCHVVEVNDLRFTPADMDERLNAFISAQAKTKQGRTGATEIPHSINTAQPTEQERACAMLDKIPCAEQTYEDWVQVGMILKNTGNSLSDWENWSRADSRYKQDECAEKWKGFNGDGLTIASLHKLAKLYGYLEKDFQRDWYQQHGTSRKVIHASEPTDDDDRQPRTRDTIKDCPVDLVLPDNYLFRRGGITLVVPPKKDGDDPKYICVARTPIIPTKIFREPTKSKFSYEIKILTRNVWRTVEIEGRTLADPRAIITLADNGALILEPKLTCRFLVDVIALNPDLQEIKAYNQTGWTDDTFKDFVYPRAEGCILRRAGFDFDRDLAKRGDPDLWKEKFIEVTKKGGAVAAMYIGTALAAVLARPLNIMNPQTHVYGTSGSAKTALQKFTASIFGNPRELMRNFAATNKNRQLVSAAFCDLPTFYDELETLQGKAAEEQLSSDVYNFADGKGNQANKRDGTARETFRFGGARLTTGERPILKQNDLHGAYKRLIQLAVQKPILDDESATDLHIFSESNFGHFGDEWTKYVTEHLDEIREEYRHYSTSYNPTLKIFEPTHLKSVTAALIAFEFFKVMLGINAKFDEDCAFIRNRRAIVDTLPTTADLDDKKRAIDALGSYVSSHEKTFARDATDTDTNKTVEIGAWGTTCSGKIFDIGAVAIHPTELRRILEDELHFASADKLINEWILDGTLITDTGRKTKVIKIGEKTHRVYYFKAGAISTSNDSAESDYYEKLSAVD